jgi:hypothetical protein
MTTPAPRRHWLDSRLPLLSALLALAVLLPAAALFAQGWGDTSEKVAFAQRERHGLAYLMALGPVETALTDAQSTAVAGVTGNDTRLNHAVDAATAVDQRYGGELRTRERWSELRTRIGALSGRDIDSPATAYSSYSQVTALLLALYDKVRSESGLIRDPDADVYYLEDGAAQELPEGVVAAGQYGDLIAIALGQPAAQQADTVGGIIQARSSLAGNAVDLTDDLQLAVDATVSRTLSSELLSRLDRFRRSIDALAPADVATANRVTAADADRVSANRAATESSAADLSSAILRSIDGLIVTRLNGLTGENRLAIGLLVVAALLAVAPTGLLLLARRRHRRATDRPAAPHDAPGGPGGPGGPERPGGAAEPLVGAEPAPGGAHHVKPWLPDNPGGAGTARTDSAGWERSGAAR